jgi:nucleoside-diphosphate-sugar epimerase
MTIVVTGAAGFLGSRLIKALLAEADAQGSAIRIIAGDLAPCPTTDPRVVSRTGSIADRSFIDSIVEPDTGVVFHLAAVLSGQSEAEFDVGMRTNVDATRALLEACARLSRPPRFVFSSSIAVFGGPLPEVVPDDMALQPQSSYGTEKAIGELLVGDYSRRGWIDGVSCRLPTVAIRPGRPNSALSSFVSGIIREPLSGIDAVCPVPLNTKMWITSPEVVTRNLLHAARMATGDLDGRRSFNLPGLTVTPAQMLDSLERLAGPAVRARVRLEVDDRMMRVISTWPGTFDTRHAASAGFVADADIDTLIRNYMREAAIESAAPPDPRR